MDSAGPAVPERCVEAMSKLPCKSAPGGRRGITKHLLKSCSQLRVVRILSHGPKTWFPRKTLRIRQFPMSIPNGPETTGYVDRTDMGMS